MDWLIGLVLGYLILYLLGELGAASDTPRSHVQTPLDAWSLFVGARSLFGDASQGRGVDGGWGGDGWGWPFWYASSGSDHGDSDGGGSDFSFDFGE